jgi:hypothetical protein
MTTESLRYDHPNHQIRREHSITTVAGATTNSSKMRTFQALKLKAVHFTVVTAGTNAGHGYTIQNGTTSIGTVSLGTNTAGYTTSVAMSDAAIASGEDFSLKSLVDATGVVDAVFEYETDKAALITK